MLITEAQLLKIMPNAKRFVKDALPHINKTAIDYGITTERRLAGWLATLAVESGELRYQAEIANGSAYEGRNDLGNTQKGDGRRFKGHGRIQVTGRSNHQAYTNYLKKSGHLPFIDFIQEPEKLALEPYATDAAGWFWAIKVKNNAAADRGDFLLTQVRVNGRNKKTGLPNHWKERNNYYQKALSVLPDNLQVSVADQLPASKAPQETSEEQAGLSGAATELNNDMEQGAIGAKVEIEDGNIKAETNQPAFVPEDKEITAPAKDGAEAKAVGGTILGIGVPTVVYTLFKGIQEWIEKGFLDAKELFNGITSFIAANTKFIFILIGLIIAVILVKKVFKQITFIVSMFIAANPSWHNVTITPAPVEKKAWWKFW